MLLTWYDVHESVPGLVLLPARHLPLLPPAELGAVLLQDLELLLDLSVHDAAAVLLVELQHRDRVVGQAAAAPAVRHLVRQPAGSPGEGEGGGRRKILYLKLLKLLRERIS